MRSGRDGHRRAGAILSSTTVFDRPRRKLEYRERDASHRRLSRVQIAGGNRSDAEGERPYDHCLSRHLGHDA